MQVTSWQKTTPKKTSYKTAVSSPSSDMQVTVTQLLYRNSNPTTDSITREITQCTITHRERSYLLGLAFFAKIFGNLVVGVGDSSAFETADEEYKEEPDGKIRQEREEELCYADSYDGALQNCPGPEIWQGPEQ